MQREQREQKRYADIHSKVQDFIDMIVCISPSYSILGGSTAVVAS
jgi:hypothetical protein